MLTLHNGEYEHNSPGRYREACVFAPTRREHQAARMKQICVYFL